MTVKSAYFPLKGGLDLTTPLLAKDAGRLIACQNYEAIIGGGYRSLEGYVRYDGSVSPTVPAAVPGSGPVRGLAVLSGAVFAFRDNAGGTAGALYKATTSGWVLQDLGHTLAFVSGTAAFTEGATVKGATSGAEATIRRVLVTTGTYTAGRLTLYGITGTFQTGENLQISGVTKAVASGVPVANTLPAGGRYETIVHNFYASASKRSLYGANGVGDAFEWTGSYFTPIKTGTTTYYPRHVAAHASRLFLGFAAGSVQYSGTGLPCIFEALKGAGEIGPGDEVTGLHPQPGGVLAIRCRNMIHLLYGTTTFEMKLHSPISGGAPYTGQTLQDTYFLDAGSITSLAATQNFGDFQTASMSSLIEPFLRDYWLYANASMVCREKGQYRLFFDGGTGGFADGVGVYMTVDNSRLTGLTLTKFPDRVSCTGQGEDANGNELLLFGSSDGWVYQLDQGVAFDDEPVTGFVRLAFHHFKNPSYRKRFRQATFDMWGDDEIHLTFTADFDYADPDIASHALRAFDRNWGSGGFWESSNWDEFYWDSKLVPEAQVDLAGTGRNLSLIILNQGTYLHALNGVVIEYSDRRLVR